MTVAGATRGKRAKKPAPKVRACRVCGCTDDRACVGGCSWVSRNLCSACADRIAAQVDTVAAVALDELRDFVSMGQAAQLAANEAIADTALYPPWKPCDEPGCTAWTRGEFCPRHRAT